MRECVHLLWPLCFCRENALDFDVIHSCYRALEDEREREGERVKVTITLILIAILQMKSNGIMRLCVCMCVCADVYRAI